LPSSSGRSARQPADADLLAWRGQTFGLWFAVHNHGQAGHTVGYVDDLSLSVSAPPPQALELDGTWLASDVTDYAASGLPGFDQRQDGWVVVAQVRVKLLQMGEHWVRFSMSNWRNSDVFYDEASVLGSLNAAQMDVGMAEHIKIFLPLSFKQ